MSRDASMVLVFCCFIILTFPFDGHAIDPWQLGPGESSYIYGMHDPGAETVMRESIRNADDGMPEDCDNGWVVFAEGIGSGGTPAYCGDYSGFTGAGFGVIVRLDHGWGAGDGTIPVPDRYDEFAATCAEFVRCSPGDVHNWIIGNEPNLSWSRPDGMTITPENYVDCYLQARRAIKAVAGHGDDRVIVAAIGPWNVESGDWIDYYRRVLGGVGSEFDGVAIHAYTRDSCGSNDPALLRSAELDGNGWIMHFRVFETFMDNVPSDKRAFPVYLTETDANISWLNEDRGWLEEAFTVINEWNVAHPGRLIRVVAPYRWQPYDCNDAECRCFTISGKSALIQDFRDAMSHGYRWTTEGCSVTPGCTADDDCGTGTICNLSSRECSAGTPCSGDSSCGGGEICRTWDSICVPVSRGEATLLFTPPAPRPGEEVLVEAEHATTGLTNVAMTVRDPSGGDVPTTWREDLIHATPPYRWAWNFTPAAAGTHMAVFRADPGGKVYAIGYVQVVETAFPDAADEPDAAADPAGETTVDGEIPGDGVAPDLAPDGVLPDVPSQDADTGAETTSSVMEGGCGCSIVK